MHFTDPTVGLIGANAIVAGGVPHAAGFALVKKMQGKDQIALAIFGEGAVNQGVFLETLNLAVVWKIPVIFLCENNLYSEDDSFSRNHIECRHLSAWSLFWHAGRSS